MSARLVEAGVAGLADFYEEQDASPLDTLEIYLERIERLNPRLNAYLHVRTDEAREEALASAERWAAGDPLSALDGVPIAVKANIAVAGSPWHAGIGAYRDRIASDDAAVIEALKDAGAIVLGVLNMHEGALGATTNNPWFGKCLNPWGDDLTPGGSSGGSGSAVAGGLCAAALGTDTMGSVRIPSAYCGCVGHKPTMGFVPNDGVEDLSWTYDHVGPHARFVSDAALVLDVLSGDDVSGALTSPNDPLDGAVIGVLEIDGMDGVSADVAEALRAAVELCDVAGAEVAPVSFKDYDFGQMRRLGLLVSEAEGSAVHAEALETHPDGFSSEFRGLLDWGANKRAVDLAEAYYELRDAGARVRDTLADFDAVLMPTAPQTAFSFSTQVPSNQADFTAIANFSGAPACALPVGLNAAGLPLSVQFLGEVGADAQVLALADAFEQERGSFPFPPSVA
ncbi:MAG: amidase [Pseudomonadota bacterium]